MPPGFPKNTLPVGRALTAVMMSYPEKLGETLDILYHASFAEHQDVVENDVLESLLVKVHGQAGAKETIAKAGPAPTKGLL